MSILLINPPRAIGKGNIWGKIDPILPPLGLAYIASYLEQQGHKACILDLQAEPMDAPQLKSYIRKISPEFIGIGSTTVEIESALSLARLARESLPGAKIVLGGVHPSVMPDEVLSNPQVDFVVRGEGEQTLYELVSNRNNVPQICGLSYKENTGIVHNPPRPVIEDLDTMPMPAYHLLPMDKYRPSLGNYKRLPAASMIATRGCPGRCTFCYTGIFGKKIRTRSAGKLLEEIKLLQKDYGIKEISFYDDTFTAFKENVASFCAGIIKEKIDISWSCMSRVDFVDREILRLMGQAGCHQIGYGLESASEEILNNINKPLSQALAKETVKLTQQAGIDVRAMFMLGNPGETEQTIRQTINFALEIDPDLVIFNIATPFPGTQMYNWAKDNGYLPDTDWGSFDLANAVMRLPTVSAGQIRHYYNLAYRRFYLRPLYLWKRLCRIRTLVDMEKNIRSLVSILFFEAESRQRI